MKTLRASFAALLVAAALGWSPAAIAQGGCVADIRQLPPDAQAMTLPEALQRAGVSGQVVDAQLCPSGGGYVYRVRIRDARGRVESMQIPAG